MSLNPIPFLSGCVSILALLLTGCGGDDAPPPAVAVEQAPAVLEQVTKVAPVANPQLQALLHDASVALQAKNYPTALFLLQQLSARADLNAEQQRLVASSLLAVHKALAEQASAGSVPAQQAMQHYRATK